MGFNPKTSNEIVATGTGEINFYTIQEVRRRKDVENEFKLKIERFGSEKRGYSDLGAILTCHAYVGHYLFIGDH